MSWGRHVREPELLLDVSRLTGAVEPVLLPDRRAEVRAALLERAARFTPEWVPSGRHDAGVALAGTYAALAETVHDRLDRLPARLLFELLDVAGVRALPARPADALMVVSADDDAPAPVSLAPRFAFEVAGGADAATLEIDHGCDVLPGSVAVVATLAGGWDLVDTPDELGRMAPFGRYPTIRSECWIGLDTDVAPFGFVNLLFVAAVGDERASAVDSAVRVPDARPMLRWEALTATGVQPLIVERDGTQGLTATGVVQLRVDARAVWTRGTLPGRPGDPPMRWVRIRPITLNGIGDVRLSAVLLNGVPAVAARTVRSEVAVPVARPDVGRSTYRLSQTPVLSGSVVLDVTDAGGTTRWSEVDDLAAAASDAAVFALDPASGTLTFGDGVAGRAVPKGYRNVVAVEYRTGGGTQGLPAVGDGVRARRSLPGLGEATVVAITTGADDERLESYLRRGPGEIRSGRRAVAPADYVTRALTAGGVDIARAHCLPATDPRDGTRTPGVVGVLVVPHRATPDEFPEADDATLRAVAEHLARDEGIAGAEVIAVPPRVRTIRVHATLVVIPGADPAGVVATVRAEIDRWFDPLVGGDGGGWPFGGTVRWNELVRRILAATAGLGAVSQLAFEAGSRLLAPCDDVELDPDELIRPGSHQLDVVAEVTS